jgi:hypothetical protein
MTKKIMRATYSSSKTPLRLGATEIPCYVLEDGTAVLSGRGMQNLLGFPASATGTSIYGLIKRKKLRDFVSTELEESIKTPLQFLRIGSGGSQPLTNGYEATILIDICYVLIDAKNAGVELSDRELILERQAEIIVRAFSKTGIIAVIYNLTGYQDEVLKGVLNEILNKYLLKEAKKYVVTYPLELYKQWYRLNGWQWKDENKQKRNPVLGNWTRDLIYSRMAPGLLKELERKNPKNEKGYRDVKHFQLLTDEVGEPRLREFFGGLIALARASSTWRKYYDMVQRAYPKYGKTLLLDFPDSEEK